MPGASTSDDGTTRWLPATGRHTSGRELPLELSFGELVRDGKPLRHGVRAGPLRSGARRRGPQESEERFRRAALMSSDLIHECDRENNRFVWFGDIDRILGYAEGEFPRTFEGWEKAIHPEDHARVMSATSRHWDTGEPFFAEYRVVRKDGGLLHWHHSGTLLRGTQGKPSRCIGTVSDISGRRQIEEALRISEKRYRTLFERNLAGVYRSTLDGRILDCNESFARIFGYTSREEMLQQTAWDMYLKREDRRGGRREAARAPVPHELRDLPQAQGRQQRLGPREREPDRGPRRPALDHRGHRHRHHGAQAGRGAGQAPGLPRSR